MTTSVSPDLCIVVDLDAAKVHTPAGSKKVTPADVETLLPSMEKDGQLIPGVVYPHPTMTGHWLCADGNHRLLVCRLLGIPFKAIALKEAPTEEKIIHIRVTTHFQRRPVTAYELAADIEKWMMLKQANQKQAAAFFSMSEPQVSKILNKARNAVPAVVQAEQMRTICEDIGRLLATLPKPRQVEALDHVVKNNMKRDDVEAYVTSLKGFQKTKSLSVVTIEDGGAKISLPANWSLQNVIDLAAKLTVAAKRGLKVPGLTSVALPNLLRSGHQ